MFDLQTGNVDNTFIINENTGSITMQKSVGTAGNIILTVMVSSSVYYNIKYNTRRLVQIHQA